MTAHSNEHIVRAHNFLLCLVRRREDTLSINCYFNCTVLKAVSNVQQFLNVMNL